MTMTDQATMMDAPTLAEIYRAVLRVEQQTILTNGRVNALEVTGAAIETRLDVLEHAHETCPVLRPATAHTRRTDLKTHDRSDDLPIEPIGFWAKRIGVGLATLGGVIWITVEMLWRLGDWLHAAGVRK